MSNACVTNAKSSQNSSITAREMSDAAVTKVRFDSVQFISRASIPFSLPDFKINPLTPAVAIRHGYSYKASLSVRVPGCQKLQTTA